MNRGRNLQRLTESGAKKRMSEHIKHHIQCHNLSDPQVERFSELCEILHLHQYQRRKFRDDWLIPV